MSVDKVNTLARLSDKERAHLVPLGLAVGPDVVRALKEIAGQEEILHPTRLKSGVYHYYCGLTGQGGTVPTHRVDELIAPPKTRRAE